MLTRISKLHVPSYMKNTRIQRLDTNLQQNKNVRQRHVASPSMLENMAEFIVLTQIYNGIQRRASNERWLVRCFYFLRMESPKSRTPFGFTVQIRTRRSTPSASARPLQCALPLLETLPSDLFKNFVLHKNFVCLHFC